MCVYMCPSAIVTHTWLDYARLEFYDLESSVSVSDVRQGARVHTHNQQAQLTKMRISRRFPPVNGLPFVGSGKLPSIHVHQIVHPFLHYIYVNARMQKPVLGPFYHIL